MLHSGKTPPEMKHTFCHLSEEQHRQFVLWVSKEVPVKESQEDSSFQMRESCDQIHI